MKLSASFLLLFALAACAASQGAPKRPWRVEVTTSGGFAGRGAGDYAIDSDGKVDARLFNGNACKFTTSADDLRRFETILGESHPEQWAPSYVPDDPCCDRIEYVLTFDEAGVKKTTKWIDDPLPMPGGLTALADAMMGGDAKSVRMQAAERCQ